MQDALADPTTRRHGRMRGVAVATLLTVGTLLVVGAAIGIWAQRQALDTDNWVETSGDLIENEPIRSAVGLYLVDRLYDAGQVQERLGSALPARLDALAAPAAAALKQGAERNAPRLLGTAVALQAWRDANRAAHETLLKVIAGADVPVDLNLGDLLKQVAANVGVPPDAVDRLPAEVAQLQIAPPEKIENLRAAIDVLRVIGWVLLALAAVAFAAAIFVAPDRRRTTLSTGACLILAGIAILALRKLAGDWIVNALADAPNAHAIADDAWSIATSQMVSAAAGGILLGLMLALGAYLVGPGKRATQARRMASPAFRRHPAVARVVLALLLGLLILWGPVPWTQQAIPLLLATIAAYVWLEVLMRRAVAESPTPPDRAGAPGPAAAPS